MLSRHPPRDTGDFCGRQRVELSRSDCAGACNSSRSGAVDTPPSMRLAAPSGAASAPLGAHAATVRGIRAAGRLEASRSHTYLSPPCASASWAQSGRGRSSSPVWPCRCRRRGLGRGRHRAGVPGVHGGLSRGRGRAAAEAQPRERRRRLERRRGLGRRRLGRRGLGRRRVERGLGRKPRLGRGPQRVAAPRLGRLREVGVEATGATRGRATVPWEHIRGPRRSDGGCEHLPEHGRSGLRTWTKIRCLALMCGFWG